MSKESLLEEITQKDGKFPRMCLFSDTTVVDMINKHLPDEPIKIKKGDYVVGRSERNSYIFGNLTSSELDSDNEWQVGDYEYVKAETCRLATVEEKLFLHDLNLD